MVVLVALAALALASPAGALAPGEASFVTRAAKRPRISRIGGLIRWSAVDPTGYYVLRRRIGRHEPEFALVAGTAVRPPVLPHRNLGYSVRAATGGAWSREVRIPYRQVAGTLPAIQLSQLGSFQPPPEVSFSERPGRTELGLSGQTLRWEAVDPAGAYLLERRFAHAPAEYAVVNGTELTPPPAAGETVIYRVKAVTAGAWSQAIAVSYPGEPEGEHAEEGKEPEKEESSQGGAVVGAAPTGPAPPPGGWHVALADGFGAPLGTAPNQDNFWYPNESCCNPALDVHGNNPDELQVYNSSQVHVGAEGLELVDQYAPGRRPPTNGYAAANYVSGAVQDFPEYEPAGYSGFSWVPGKGERWAFECYCRLPLNTGEVDPGWWSTDRPWTDEVDFFEEWGWGSVTKPLTGVVWLYETAGRHLIESNNSLLALFDPAAAFHRYTTVINSDNSIEEFIDGVRQGWLGNGGVLGPPPHVVQARMSLILSNALREKTRSGPDPAPNFQSGSRAFTVRSIAVYEDGAHAGQDVTGGGVAPGTTIAR